MPVGNGLGSCLSRSLNKRHPSYSRHRYYLYVECYAAQSSRKKVLNERHRYSRCKEMISYTYSPATVLD